MKKVLTLVAFLLFLLWGCATLKNAGEEKREGSKEQAERSLTATPAANVEARPTGNSTRGDNQAVSTRSANMDSHKQPTTAQIRLVQLRLKAAGYDPGPIDGLFGPKTKTALRKYQELHGLSHNGGLDEKTLKALGME